MNEAKIARQRRKAEIASGAYSRGLRSRCSPGRVGARRQRFHSSCAVLIAPGKATTSDGNASMNKPFLLRPNLEVHAVVERRDRRLF